MDRLIILYLYIFIPVSLLTGFMLRNNITVGGLTPSLFLTATISAIIALYYANRAFKKNKIHISIYWGIILFLLFPILYLSIHGYKYIFAEYNYSISILSSIFILVYISYYSDINLTKLEKIIHVSNVVLITNILLSSLLDVGYPSYIVSGFEVGNKGYLYGGNTASVLSIAVLIFYLFNNKYNVFYKWTFVSLSLIAAILVKTIASVLAPLLLMVYLVTKSNYRLLYIVGGIVFILVTPYSKQIINDFSEESYRVQRMIESNESINESRRIYDSYLQMKYQVENPITIIFGTGRSGQIKFWNRDMFNFAGMDISDIMMRYGLLGFILISIIYIRPIFKYYSKYKIDNVLMSSSLILLYGLFGGYLFTSITSLVYLTLLISYINIYLRDINEVSIKRMKSLKLYKYNA